MTAVLIVEGREDMSFLPEDNEVLLHHSVMYTWTDSSIVSTG